MVGFALNRQVKRKKKNLARCHLADKMGISAALTKSWEAGSTHPMIISGRC